MPNRFETKMVDLQTQYQGIKNEVLPAIEHLLENASFINGPVVHSFEEHLAAYLGVKHVISCANGTDAIQLALMALDLPKDSEILVPGFTFIATAEVVAFLGLTPVFVDVDPDDFNMSVEDIKAKITPRTKAILPVHLFGQSADMDLIMEIAAEHHLFVVEDNAQAIGTSYKKTRKTGTIGDLGTTSFFPSKNLGAYGDGGAVMTNDDVLADRIRVIANHGMKKRYYHEVVGINSRLDTLQAAVLDVKLKKLDEYLLKRIEAAAVYDTFLTDHTDIQVPLRRSYSEHTFHQYTLKIKGGKRDKVKEVLLREQIPFGIYYPIPLHKQEAFAANGSGDLYLPVSEKLCTEVISLPMHTELHTQEQEYICQRILEAL